MEVMDPIVLMGSYDIANPDRPYEVPVIEASCHFLDEDPRPRKGHQPSRDGVEICAQASRISKLPAFPHSFQVQVLRSGPLAQRVSSPGYLCS